MHKRKDVINTFTESDVLLFGRNVMHRVNPVAPERIVKHMYDGTFVAVFRPSWSIKWANDVTRSIFRWKFLYNRIVDRLLYLITIYSTGPYEP